MSDKSKRPAIYAGELMPVGEHGDRLSERLSHGAPLAAIVLVSLGIGIFLISRLISIIEIIAVAMLVALVLRTIVDALVGLGLPRWLAVVAIIVGIVLSGVLVWYVLIPEIINEIQKLTSSGGPQSIRQRLQPLISEVTDFLRGIPFIPKGFVSRLPQFLNGIFSGLNGSLSGPLRGLVSTFSSTLIGVIGVAFLALYFAISPGTYVSGILGLVPRHRRPRARRFFSRLESTLRAWIAGTLLVALVMGVGAGIGLWILGIPLPLVFGIVVGVLSIIPFVGSAAGGLFPGLLALTISPTKALTVGVLFLVLAQLDGNVLRPLIFSREVKVPPAWVLISILILGTLLGPVAGTFLAVPVAVLVRVILEELKDKDPPEMEPSPEDKGKEEPPDPTDP